MVSPAIQGVARDLARESRIQRLFQQRRGIVQSAMAKDEKLARLKEEQQAVCLSPPPAVPPSHLCDALYRRRWVTREVGFSTSWGGVGWGHKG